MDGALGLSGLLGGLAQLGSIASAFFLGGRLLRRALRGAGQPELLLGLHLFLAMGMGSLVLSYVSLSAYAETSASPSTLAGLALAGNAITILGLMAALWFNYRVFHSGESAGRLLAGAGTALMWIGLAYYVWAGGLAAPGRFGPEYWPFCAAQVLADLWVAGEALRFRAQMKKRLALGLVEPIVVERLGLWGYGALARMGLVTMAPTVTALVPSFERRAEIAPVLLLLSAFLIASTCVAYWLMLAPTAGYRRWVERRYAAASAR
jgi:hypothetical protein